MKTTVYRTQKPLDHCSVTVKMAADGSYIWELRSTKRFDTPAQAFYDAMLNMPAAEEPEKKTEAEPWIPIYAMFKEGESK